MTLAGWADLRRTPLDLPSDDSDRAAALYTEALGRLPELADHPERFRNLWDEEDAALDREPRSCWRSGRIEIDERPELDLVIVDVPDDVELSGGHRFAHEWVSGPHPMALHNATRGLTLLVRQGRRYELTYRYESWVQYRSRPVRARRDLGVLAAELSAEEPGDATWRYDGSGSLAPSLRLHGADESAIDPDEFLRRLDAFVATAPADWDPFAARDEPRDSSSVVRTRSAASPWRPVDHDDALDHVARDLVERAAAQHHRYDRAARVPAEGAQDAGDPRRAPERRDHEARPRAGRAEAPRRIGERSAARAGCSPLEGVGTPPMESNRAGV